ncbi:MAG: porin family protein [Bacteroidota bacterium]
MKKVFFILGFLVIAQSAQAQLFSKERLSNLETFDNRFLSWGYYLGFNSYDFKIEYNNQDTDANTDILVERQGGFNVGLIGDMRVNRYVNLRLEPGLYFTQRDLRFPNFEEERDILRNVKSTYIHVPLLVKFSTKRLNNIKPFIVAGVSRSFNLSSNENNPEDNGEGQFRMTKGTNYFELGFGIDFYLFYFKFTPSIRGVFATTNELIPDDDPNSPWTSNIGSLESRGIFVNFTFQ